MRKGVNGCNIIEMIDYDDEEGVARLKFALISLIMNRVHRFNDTINYSDDQLRQLIKNFLERCVANVVINYYYTITEY